VLVSLMLLAQMGRDGLLVEVIGLAALDGDRALWTMSQTRAEPVTQVVGDEFRLAVDDADGTLLAGGNAQTTAIALILVDAHDFANHGASFQRAADVLSAELILS